jgi:hypothetical protein
MKFFRILFLMFAVLSLFSLVFASEYQLKRASELSIGDVIVASDGTEILVEKIEVLGRSNIVYENSSSIGSILWERIAGRSLPDPIVSSGSELDFSQGLTGHAVSDLKVYEKKSFWEKLKFWRWRNGN